MEFLRSHKRRSLLSETVYILLNIALAVSTLVAIVATGTPWLALIFVLLSKWRVFAVRPRFWFAHVESNMVDFIVSISLVVLMFLAGQGATSGLGVQIFLMLVYVAWLLFLKPRAKRNSVVLQAGAAVLFGTMALASVSYEWPSSLVVLIMWLIGYSTARHTLAAYSDSDIRLMSLIWGFVAAEIGWLSFHWMIAYNLPLTSSLKLPQMTLLLLGISFLAERVYHSIHKHEKIRMNDIIMPLVLVLGIMAVLLIFFSSATIGATI